MVYISDKCFKQCSSILDPLCLSAFFSLVSLVYAIPPPVLLCLIIALDITSNQVAQVTVA